MSMDLKEYFSTTGIKGKVQKAIALETGQALRSFCGQEPEFTQAIEQSGRTFQQCLDKVAAGVSGSLSDFEAYSRAVEFYFPGAKVIFQMRINLVGDADKPEPVKPLTVSFDSLLDF